MEQKMVHWLKITSFWTYAIFSLLLTSSNEFGLCQPAVKIHESEQKQHELTALSWLLSCRALACWNLCTWGCYKICVPGFSGFGLCHRHMPIIYVNSLWKFEILITKVKYLYRYTTGWSFFNGSLLLLSLMEITSSSILPGVFDQAVVMRTSKQHICSWDLACNEYLFLQMREHKGMEIFLLWHVFVAYYW